MISIKVVFLYEAPKKNETDGENELIAQLDRAFIKARPWKLWSRLLAYTLIEGRPLTTKGQWFNPVVFGFYKLCRLIGFGHRVSDPVFIVGMGRSGTTALGSVLSMHRDIAYLNEPKALWHSIDENEDLIGSYSQKVGQYRLSPESVDDIKTKKISSVYKSLLFLTKSKKIVDKYPELLFRIPYVLALFPDAKFIVITRNGVDNCKSIEQWCIDHRQVSAGVQHDWWGKGNRKWNAICQQLLPKYDDLIEVKDQIKNFENDFDKACVEWIVTTREADYALKSYPKNVVRVEYDELCSDPESVLKQILKVIDLQNDDNVFINYGIETLKRQSKSVKDAEIESNIDLAFASTMRDFGYGG